MKAKCDGQWYELPLFAVFPPVHPHPKGQRKKRKNEQIIMQYIIFERTGTHAIHPLDTERTLCGDVICDRDKEDIAHHGRIIKRSRTGKLTCPQCLHVVRYCRAKRT